MSNTISHAGVIASISTGIVHVRIVQKSACASCKIASQCTSSESKEKMIDVYTTDTSGYSVGESVNVIASSSVGTQAVIYGFVVPLVIMMIAIIVSLKLSDFPEPLAALIGIVSLVPYYTLLYILRNKLQRVLSFHIEKI